MANNYLQFSTEIQVLDPPRLQEVLDNLKELRENDDFLESMKALYPQSEGWKAFTSAIEDYNYENLGFTWYYHERWIDKLYIFTEDWGLVESAARFIHFLMSERIVSSDPVLLTWAETCDKPRPDEFGGGACLITSSQVHWQESATQWADEIIQKHYPKANPHELRVSRENEHADQ